jgi:hypothetical protein
LWLDLNFTVAGFPGTICWAIELVYHFKCVALIGIAMDSSDEFKKAAAECAILARTTNDPRIRAGLLMLAQNLYDQANGLSTDFDAIVRDFNDEQMARH